MVPKLSLACCQNCLLRVTNSFRLKGNARLGFLLGKRFNNACFEFPYLSVPCREFGIHLITDKANSVLGFTASVSNNIYSNLCIATTQLSIKIQFIEQVQNIPLPNKPAHHDEITTWRFSVWFPHPWVVNTLKPRQDGRDFADDIFEIILWNENV